MSMKKGWRRYGVAVVCLVMLSMLVPLVFLLGLYGGFQTSYVNDEGPSKVNQTVESKVLSLLDKDVTSLKTEKHYFSRIGDFVNKSLSPPQKVSNDGGRAMSLNLSANNTNVSIVKNTDIKAGHNFSKNADNLDKLLNRHPISGGSDVLNFSWNSARNAGLPEKVGSSLPDRRVERKSEKLLQRDVKKKVDLSFVLNDTDKACEVDLGSYCVWSDEHREEMSDSMVKVMKNQLFLARAYYPSIAKHRTREKIQHELRQHIQSHEHILSEATADADLPQNALKKVKAMDGVLAKMKDHPVDCNNVVKKLGQILDLTEDEAHFHRKQSVFLYQLAVQTMPKSLHCLSMRLTVEYFHTYEGGIQLPFSKNLEDLDLYHYVIYSTNILAASVVVNSTVTHAKEPEKHVFHLITDGQNHIAMKFWFLENNYCNATVHVQTLDDSKIQNSSNSVVASLSLEEFRIAVESSTKKSSDLSNSNKINYLSTFNHPHFWISELFPRLNKVLFLGDNVVVQRDLTPLWSIDLQGKVNGAVEVCEVRFHHLRKYLNSSKFFATGFDGNTCTWMSGMNIIDLQQWRKQDLTKIYKRWRKMQNRYNVPWRFGTLPASLITFHNMTFNLDESWLLSGLGHNFGIDRYDIQKSAVLHYNGVMKPWLEIGIKKYKPYWAKYLKQNDQFMQECNVNR